MAYCDSQAIRVRLPALPAAGVNPKTDAMIEEGICCADGEIDAALRKFTDALPLNPVPKLLSSICSALAAAFVLDASFSGGGEDDSTPLSSSLRSWGERKLEQICDRDLVLEGVNDDVPVALPEGEQPYIPGTHTRIGQVKQIETFEQECTFRDFHPNRDRYYRRRRGRF